MLQQLLKIYDFFYLYINLRLLRCMKTSIQQFLKLKCQLQADCARVGCLPFQSSQNCGEALIRTYFWFVALQILGSKQTFAFLAAYPRSCSCSCSCSCSKELVYHQKRQYLFLFFSYYYFYFQVVGYGYDFEK